MHRYSSEHRMGLQCLLHWDYNVYFTPGVSSHNLGQIYRIHGNSINNIIAWQWISCVIVFSKLKKINIFEESSPMSSHHVLCFHLPCTQRASKDLGLREELKMSSNVKGLSFRNLCPEKQDKRKVNSCQKRKHWRRLAQISIPTFVKFSSYGRNSR